MKNPGDPIKYVSNHARTFDPNGYPERLLPFNETGQSRGRLPAGKYHF